MKDVDDATRVAQLRSLVELVRASGITPLGLARFWQADGMAEDMREWNEGNEPDDQMTSPWEEWEAERDAVLDDATDMIIDEYAEVAEYMTMIYGPNPEADGVGNPFD